MTAAMMELASELDGESGYPVGQSEPSLARLQRGGMVADAAGTPG